MSASKLSASSVQLGDYVLATKYSDADPQDPWRVGFIVRIIETWCPRSHANTRTYIVGEQDATWTDAREYRHARKITPEEGRAHIEAEANHPTAVRVSETGEEGVG